MKVKAMDINSFNSAFPRAKAGAYAVIARLRGKYKLADLPLFVANMGHESAGFTVFEENLGYSADGLLRTFPKYFTPVTARQFARKPVDIANIVYANRMGNGGRAGGDGYKYRGRGAIQITGRANYREMGDAMGLNLITYPDLLTKLDNAIWSAFEWWAARVEGKYSSADEARRIVNGGANGLAEVKRLYDILK